MRRAATVVALLAVLTGCGGATEAPSDDRPYEDEIGDDSTMVVLDLKDGTSLDALKEFAKRHGGIDVRWAAEHEPGATGAGLAVASVPLDRQRAFLAEVRKDPIVERAEHDEILQFPEIGTLDAFGEGDLIPDDGSHKPAPGFPNDPFFAKQWHMQMVHAKEAWKRATGKGVIVAVIDTGVTYESKRGIKAPDFADTDFVPGWDFVHDDAIPADDQGHGSHCAGTIAQSTNNGRGVGGLAPRARIMPIKVLNSHGSGTMDAVIAGIRYAADHKAKVLSLSLGGGGRSQMLDDAVKYARSKGCAVVCAAGNARRGRVEYPAACPGAFAVSSVGPTGKLAFYSSWGKELLCAGPGGDKSNGPEGGVLQSTLDPRDHKKTVFAWYQGTSMATPHVAALCALLAEAGVSNPEDMKKIIMKTSRKPEGVPEGWDEKYGWGIIDADAALKKASAVPSEAALAFAVLLAGVAIRLTKSRDLGRPLLALGAVVGSSGFFFLPLDADAPGAGVLQHGLPSWGSSLLGLDGWSPLFASALIPFVLGLVASRSQPWRSVTVGLALGAAAHLGAQATLGWSCVSFVPESLETPWLLVNAVVLVASAAAFVRLGRTNATPTPTS